MIVVVGSAISALARPSIGHFFEATHVKLPESQTLVQRGHASREDLAITLQINSRSELKQRLLRFAVAN